MLLMSVNFIGSEPCIAMMSERPISVIRNSFKLEVWSRKTGDGTNILMIVLRNFVLKYILPEHKT